MGKNIDIVKDFQTSINIAFDLNDDRKIENFIPYYLSYKSVRRAISKYRC